MSFIQYIQESAANEDKLTHLEHAEDHIINAGAEGFHHAFHTLNDTHDSIQGAASSSTKTTIKYDGSPSVIFGRHPKTGKFFVASKSAFNKEPKLNYSHEDIEKNHGHSPGLVHKLKAAFEHLQKTSPKKGVFQGDIMYTRENRWNGAAHNDVKEHGGKYHFTPNTLTYSVGKDTKEGKKIDKAKIGVAVHTSYHGDDLETMKAHYGFNVHEEGSGFRDHQHVHLLPTHVEHPPSAPKSNFHKHMSAALDEFHKTTPDTHGAVTNHRVGLKTYINSTVRTGSKPTAKGYHAWLTNKHQSEVDKLKTPAGKAKRQQAMNNDLSHVKANKHHFQHILNIHGHLQNAKNELVKTLSNLDHHGYEHSIHGRPSKPEGFVSIRNNRPTKLVDRADFSRANFARNE
jgi:hypothetical protein